MAEPDKARGVLDAAVRVFLARRLQHQRRRAAEVREREGPEAPPVQDVGPVPPLSIVVMIVGSRGDVQPFIPIGRRLAARHRVRIATHRHFRSLVEEAGLEFYPLAGDPRDLMDHMLKTGGRIIPRRLDQLVEDVPKRRAMIAEILASTWRACTEPDPDRPGAPPIRADVILANPPSFGHIHCAEALHLPLHMIFTMPWSTTSVYPHPFAGLDSGGEQPLQNFLSYGLMDLLIWSGIGDLVNAFRHDFLELPSLSVLDGANLLEDHAVPFTYLWPAALMPRPDDWGPHIELANFTFHDQAQDYQPPAALREFLAGGEPPIYVGFGSVLVEDEAAVTRTIFAALQKAGARGLVSEGWAHLRGEAPPPNVFLIGDTPHDWLFRRCQAVCHHGGAGTTSAGLRAGLPTVVVPSFGDQFFWGRVVSDAGGGPPPIPITRLDTAALTAAFETCRRAEVRERARSLGALVRETDGAELVVQSVYRRLPLEAMRCQSHPDRLARIECLACGHLRCCPECATAHASHLGLPCRYVDWSARPDHGLVEELGDLVGDAASALLAGVDEIVGRIGFRPDER